MKQIKVVGLGGIGTALMPFLCRYLNYEDAKTRITLIDGDSFEEKNRKRQSFKGLGNKANSKAGELAKEFGKISFRAIPKFITPKNIGRLILEGDTVFLGVDNHRTRKIVSEHCETLKNIILISGGNELTDGNVQIFIRKKGKNITLPITKFHPEIASPKDKSPEEMSCQERAKLISSRQILITNVGAAWLMCVAFWLIEQKHTDNLGEFYFDILEGKVQPIERRQKND